MKKSQSLINYAQLIDHTYLKSDAQAHHIDKLITEAKQHGFKTICVNDTWTNYAHQQLKNSNVGLTVVIGFPLGACTTATKVFEAKNAIANGADEIDMVMNIGLLKDHKHEQIIDEITKVKHTIGNKILKVIIETALLTKKEITQATNLVIEGKADFVKTSTGFSTRGATFSDIKIMHKVAKGKIQIKASGGIKSFADLKKMVILGATRIGTSSAVSLLKGHHFTSQY